MNNFIIFKFVDGKKYIDKISQLAADTVGREYTCWCTDICGELPQRFENPRPATIEEAIAARDVVFEAVEKEYIETRNYSNQRKCMYRLELDPLFSRFYGEMLDNDYDETEMKSKLRAIKAEIKARIPK